MQHKGGSNLRLAEERKRLICAWPLRVPSITPKTKITAANGAAIRYSARKAPPLRTLVRMTVATAFGVRVSEWK
jgi:hypothetical protein